MLSMLISTGVLIYTIIPTQSKKCSGESIWKWDYTHTGLRPDCPPANIAHNVDGYFWHSIERVEQECEDHPTCNFFQRYDGGGYSCDTCYGHDYAHSCPDLNNITWIKETRWGVGANTANNYQLTCGSEPSTEEPSIEGQSTEEPG